MDIDFLKEKARLLPKNIYEWFASERAVLSVMDINKKINIAGNKRKVIPELILRLITQDINPYDFTSHLAIELNISDSSAKILTREIEDKLLHPVEDLLKQEGVDVSLLHFSGEPLIKTLTEAEEEVREKNLVVEEKSIPLKPAPVTSIKPTMPRIEVEPQIQAPPAQPSLKATAGKAGPFILHKEKEGEVKPQGQTPLASSGQVPRPTFSIKIPLGQKKYYSAPPQVTAKIETPEEEQLKGVKPGFMRPPLPMPPSKLAAPKIIPTRPPLGRLSEIMKPIEQESNPSVSSPTASRSPTGVGQAVNNPPLIIKKVVHYSNYRTLLAEEGMEV